MVTSRSRIPREPLLPSMEKNRACTVRALGAVTVNSTVGVFWGSDPDAPPASSPAGAMLVPAAVLAAVTISLGFGAEGLWVLAERAAAGLTDVALYAQAVMS